MKLLKLNEYRNYDALNFSKIAAYDKDPKSLIDLKDISDNDSIKMGSFVDNGLFSPGNNDREFIVEDVERPTGQMGDFCEELANLYIKEEDWTLIDNLGYIEKLQQEAYNKVGFKRASLGKVISKFETEGKPYFEFLINSKDKKILTKTQYNQCNKAINTLLTHKFSASIFNPVDHCEVKHQIPLAFVYNYTEYKILIDLIYINHRDKIINIFDLKTTSNSIYSFPSSVWKYRYDIQASLYTKGINICKEILGYENYTIENLVFLVYSFLNQKILLYDSTNIIIGGEYGHYDTKGKPQKKGWRQLTEEIKWSTQTGLYEYHKEIYDNNGICSLQPPV